MELLKPELRFLLNLRGEEGVLRKSLSCQDSDKDTEADTAILALQMGEAKQTSD